MSLASPFLNAGFSVVMRLLRRSLWPPFRAAAKNPEASQEELLLQILKENQDTVFGRSHGFANITSAEAFRAAVPVQDYASLKSLIEQQEERCTTTLTTEAPVLYAQTSGTSGSPKYLPITASGVKRVKRAQRLFSTMVEAETKMFEGKIVGIGSPAIEGYMVGGTPFGSASGMVYEGMPRLVRSKYVIGPKVLAIEDHDLRYRAIAALCLAEKDVTGFATANPSTLLRLHSIIVDHFDALLNVVEGEELAGVAALPNSQSDELTKALPGDVERAQELRRLWSSCGGTLSFADLWPRLNVITTWTGGSCGFALAALQPLLKPSTQVIELGYAASEVRAAIGLGPDAVGSVPLLADTWFEFVERDTRDASVEPLAVEDFLGLHQLQPQGQYYVYVTTLDGLYRYDMNDVVEVVGTFEKTPCVSFLQKGRGVTNITGEKLSEHQVLVAVSRAQEKLGVTASFFIVLADEAAAHYRLYVQHDGGAPQATALAGLVDQYLGALNIEYRSKLASGRLGAMQGFDLAAGTGTAYRADRVEAGQRDAQFKYLHVQILDECPFDFDAHLKTSTP